MGDENRFEELKDAIFAQDKIAAVNVALVTEKLDNAADERKLMRADIKDIKKTVNGNGESGLVGRVGTLESWKKTLEKVSWWVGGIVGTVVASVILFYVLRA